MTGPNIASLPAEPTLPSVGSLPRRQVAGALQARPAARSSGLDSRGEVTLRDARITPIGIDRTDQAGAAVNVRRSSSRIVDEAAREQARQLASDLQGSGKSLTAGTGEVQEEISKQTQAGKELELQKKRSQDSAGPEEFESSAQPTASEAETPATRGLSASTVAVLQKLEAQQAEKLRSGVANGSAPANDPEREELEQQAAGQNQPGQQSNDIVSKAALKKQVTEEQAKQKEQEELEVQVRRFERAENNLFQRQNLADDLEIVAAQVKRTRDESQEKASREKRAFQIEEKFARIDIRSFERREAARQDIISDRNARFDQLNIEQQDANNRVRVRQISLTESNQKEQQRRAERQVEADKAALKN